MSGDVTALARWICLMVIMCCSIIVSASVLRIERALTANHAQEQHK